MIQAHLVAERDRLSFFPAMFGPRLMMRGEALVYSWMDRLSDDYRGGFWNFYSLSNGGFYLAPESAKNFHLFVESNGFEGELSADAAGIVATLFAFNSLAAENFNGAAGDAMADRYHFLLKFARGHVEAGQIFAAID
ncbi:antirestriction protein [Chromobacterium vaccinii]|uniref:antirestriction protein n=1 Tax=Chromobacterium vaccinii TaxID=1108595 RepID=UPI00345AE40F